MRLKNWPSRFAKLVELARTRRFEWGVHDCCLWAASAVLAITGSDPAASWRGSYCTERQAIALLASVGGLAGAGSRGGVQIDVEQAATGDIGLIVWPDGTESLGICAGHTWMCAGEHGLVHLPNDAARLAWGVGRV